MVADYSISWEYIVNRMESRFGIKPNNTDKHSMAEILRYIDAIWKEYADNIDDALKWIRSKAEVRYD